MDPKSSFTWTISPYVQSRLYVNMIFVVGEFHFSWVLKGEGTRLGSIFGQTLDIKDTPRECQLFQQSFACIAWVLSNDTAQESFLYFNLLLFSHFLRPTQQPHVYLLTKNSFLLCKIYAKNCLESTFIICESISQSQKSYDLLGAKFCKVNRQESMVWRGQGKLPLLNLPPLLVRQVANDLDGVGVGVDGGWGVGGNDNCIYEFLYLISRILLTIIVIVIVKLSTSDN